MSDVVTTNKPIFLHVKYRSIDKSNKGMKMKTSLKNGQYTVNLKYNGDITNKKAISRLIR